MQWEVEAPAAGPYHHSLAFTFFCSHYSVMSLGLLWKEDYVMHGGNFQTDRTVTNVLPFSYLHVCSDTVSTQTLT